MNTIKNVLLDAVAIIAVALATLWFFGTETLIACLVVLVIAQLQHARRASRNLSATRRLLRVVQ